MFKIFFFHGCETLCFGSIADLVQNVMALVAPIFTRVVNISLASGVSALKHAIVKAIFKKTYSDYNQLANYRLVSNLSFLSKVIEKCPYLQSSYHHNENGLQELHQFSKSHLILWELHNFVLITIFKLH